MRLADGLRPARPSAWKWFPLGLAGSMAVVMAVNFGMIYAALHTFPGQAGSDGFDLSNHYDAVLAHVQAQAALGWTVKAEADTARHPVLALTGPGGAPLSGAHLDAVAERPLGAVLTTPVAFREQVPGRYVAENALILPGQWDLTLTASANGQHMVTTKRIVVR